MKLLQALGIALVVVIALAGFAGAQTWTPLNNQPEFCAGTMHLLRDGRILVHNEPNGYYCPATVLDFTAWYILTPDANGSYVNGTWSGGGSTEALGYGPLFFGSQVLLNGTQVVVEGGEYNCTQTGTCTNNWTNLGAIGTVTPFSGPLTWTANSPPSGWTEIGDAESVILADGTYMQSSCCTAKNALYNGPNSWIATGSVHQSSNDESGFTLLTNNLVLTVDAKSDRSCGGSSNSARWSELYNQSTGVWSCGPQTTVLLYNSSDEELGAAVLTYNNTVWQMGGNEVTSAVYNVATNTWSAGPIPPSGMDQADGPSALEPNGLVLAMLSPGLFNQGCEFFEYNPTSNTLAAAPDPADCPDPGSTTLGDSSYVGLLMILPTGQIMFTDESNIVEVYTPASGVVAGVAPTILLPATLLKSGSTDNLVYGYQLNGLTQNNAYGDDFQVDTDYPLVSLTCVSGTCTSGNVYYAFTHDDGPTGSTVHSIAPGHFGYTHFDLPTMPTGAYSFVAVANGITSNAINVHVK